jgi:hypothetical protein
VLLSELFEDFYAMPLPTGQWSIVSGGNNGILDITNVGAPGTTGALPRNIGALPVIVAGTLQLAQNSTLNISGTWDETHQELYFSDAEGQNRYRGYLFNAGDPLFTAGTSCKTTLAYSGGCAAVPHAVCVGT